MIPEPKTYRVAANGEEIGEMTVEDIVEATLGHTLPQDAVYWQDGADRWRPVAQMVQPRLAHLRSSATLPKTPAAGTGRAFWITLLVLAGLLVTVVVAGQIARAFQTPQQRALIRAAERASAGTREARRFAEQAVAARLKAPATAKFSGAAETFATNWGDGTFSVTGWVDAQNAFGALIRNTYFVKLRMNGGAWATEELTLTPR